MKTFLCVVRRVLAVLLALIFALLGAACLIAIPLSNNYSAMPGSVYKDGPQIATVVRTVVNILCTLLLVFFAYRIFRVWKPSKRKLAKLEAKANKA